MPKTIITFDPSSAIVQQNTDYEYSFSLKRPTADTTSSKRYAMTKTSETDGTIFSAPINKNEWINITGLEVR